MGLIRWRNSIHRGTTENALFLFSHLYMDLLRVVSGCFPGPGILLFQVIQGAPHRCERQKQQIYPGDQEWKAKTKVKQKAPGEKTPSLREGDISPCPLCQCK